MVGDAAWVLGLSTFVIGTCVGALQGEVAWSGRWGLVWGACFLVPLLWRRTAPDLATLGIIPAHVAQLMLNLTGVNVAIPANVTVPIMMYAVAAYGRRRWRYPWLVFGLICALVAAVTWSFASLSPQSPERRALNVFGIWTGCAAVVAAAWFMGSLARSRLDAMQALRDRADALERERARGVQLAASQERSRIAREMHDIVAHSLSVIVVQADGARYVVAEAPGDPQQRLAQAERAIATIRDTARVALAETRRLVGVLHSDADVAELAPAATLADVPSLVKQLTDAGRSATLAVVGDPDAHPPFGSSEQLAAYRVVQESLTNVMKHAGPGAATHVVLGHSASGLGVTVRDDGRGALESDGQGHGLIGMRERVAAFGGRLETHNRPFGGFEVRAFFPSPDEPAPDATSPTKPIPDKENR